MQLFRSCPLFAKRNYSPGGFYMIGNIGLPELIIIFLIVLFLFGAGKIPKIARDIGGGIREFKKSITGESDSNDRNNNQNGGSGRTS